MDELFEIRKHFYLESARHLPNLPESHPCHRMHGHSFKVTLGFKGPIEQSTQWVIDYNTIATGFEPLRKKLDHCVLNEVEGLGLPTTERLTQYIYNQLKLPTNPLADLLSFVEISETSDTYCRYPAS